MKKINKKDLDNTQLEYLTKTEQLQAELIKNGFIAPRIEQGEYRTDFHIVFFDGDNDYIIRRDYNDNISIIRKDWPRYKNISSHKQAEVSKSVHKSNNVKVITQKKLETLLQETKAYHTELEILEKEAQEKISTFLETLKGFYVRYSRENYQDPKSDIKSGEIVKNGIEFSFEIGQDGYISKKLKLHYAIDNTLENFMLLSDNKYLN